MLYEKSKLVFLQEKTNLVCQCYLNLIIEVKILSVFVCCFEDFAGKLKYFKELCVPE